MPNIKSSESTSVNHNYFTCALVNRPCAYWFFSKTCDWVMHSSQALPYGHTAYIPFQEDTSAHKSLKQACPPLRIWTFTFLDAKKVKVPKSFGLIGASLIHPLKHTKYLWFIHIHTHTHLCTHIFICMCIYTTLWDSSWITSFLTEKSFCYNCLKLVTSKILGNWLYTLS